MVLVKSLDLLRFVPVGRENAATARDIARAAKLAGWKGVNVYTHIYHLRTKGLVNRDAGTPDEPLCVYWREPGVEPSESSVGMSKRKAMSEISIGWRDVVKFLPDTEEGALTPVQLAGIVAREYHVKNTRAFRRVVLKRLQYAHRIGATCRVQGGRMYKYYRCSDESAARATPAVGLEALKREIVAEISGIVDRVFEKIHDDRRRAAWGREGNS
ncbi:MAG: hypothetical protein QHG98_07270 [Methanothrix sp.]|nr:hypothetical protein [Methanothrix sp.]